MQVFTDLAPNVTTIVAPANPSRQLAVVINYGGNDVFLGSVVDTGTVVKRNGGSAAIATTGVVVAIQPGPGIQQVCVYDNDAPTPQTVAGTPSKGVNSPGVVTLSKLWTPTAIDASETVDLFTIPAGALVQSPTITIQQACDALANSDVTLTDDGYRSDLPFDMGALNPDGFAGSGGHGISALDTFTTAATAAWVTDHYAANTIHLTYTPNDVPGTRKPILIFRAICHLGIFG